MTPDLTARIEAAARGCVTALKCDSSQHPTLADDEHVFETAIAQSITTLAEQVIAEKDAEAAGIIETIEGVWDAASDVNAHQAVAYLSDCLEKIKERMPTAGRDLLAELVSLRERVRELEGRIERYENSGRV